MTEWKPGRWWRVTDAAGAVWRETSDETAAREAVRRGDKLLRIWTRTETEWRPEGPDEASLVAQALTADQRAAVCQLAGVSPAPAALGKLYTEPRPAGPAILRFMTAHLPELPNSTFIPYAMAALAGTGQELTVPAVIALAVQAGMPPPAS